MNIFQTFSPDSDAAMVKFRNELKYICSETDFQIIQSRIAPICAYDRHAAPNGTYHIRSVYFDDPQNRCFYENENGTDPREKFRIRIYNASDRRITLECKKKEHSMTRKDSCPLTKQQCMAILEGRLSDCPSDDPLLNRFLTLCAETKMAPKVIVAYDRTPFVYGPGNVRITFDRNIGSTTEISRFFDPHLPLRPILPTGKHVLEVKYDEFLPTFLYSIMSLGHLQQTAFSKYYLCRKYTI